MGGNSVMSKRTKGKRRYSPRDCINSSELPANVVNKLPLSFITFRAIKERSNDQIFKSLVRQSPIKAHEALAFEAAMRRRGLSWKWPEGSITPGSVFPLAVVNRLWEANVTSSTQLANLSHAELRTIAGKHLAKIIRGARMCFGINLPRSVFWFVNETSLTKDVARLLWHDLSIRTIDDLFAADEHELTTTREGASQSRKSDMKKTVLYARWWFEKHHKKLVPREKPRSS